MNRTRVSVIGRLGKYDSSDFYKIQVQSNGKLFVNIRTGDDEPDKVLDLSKHEQRQNEIKAQLEAMGIKTEEEKIDTTPKTPLEIARAEVAKMKEAREKEKAGLLDEIAPGMTIKVHMQKGNKIVCIGDSTADKNSKEYATMKEILSGEYRAKKSMYYLEIGSEDEIKKEIPYVMQIKQGTKYTDDYLVSEGNSEDTKKETISLTSSTSSSEIISAAYAAQVQASQYDSTATMMSDAYLNLSSIKNKKSSLVKLFSGLVNKSV